MLTPAHSFHNHRFSFEKGELGTHENLMTCIIVGHRHPVTVASDTDRIEANAICIRPDVPHFVSVPEGGAEIIYLDGVRLGKERPAFSAVAPEWHRLARAFDTKDGARIQAFRNKLDQDRPPPDQSVMQVVSRLYEDPFLRVSQSDLSRALDLERTQALRHFKATTGQTFRRFKIWAAIIAATRSAHKGEQIGLAGIETGFSDAAHLARTASSVFGLTPTQGLSGLKRLVTFPDQSPCKN